MDYHSQGEVSLIFVETSKSFVISAEDGVRPSVAKMTIFIVLHGPGCAGSEVADEAYPGPEGSGAVGAGQRC